MRKQKRKIRGFTLIEVSVALAIISLISYSSYLLLSNFVKYPDLIKPRYESISELQVGLKIIHEDFSTIVDRKIREGKNKKLESMIYKKNQITEDFEEIEFSRAGRANPSSIERSDLMRIKYFLKDGVLIRRYWSIMDRSKNTKFYDQKLLSNIEKISILFFSQQDPTVSQNRDDNYNKKDFRKELFEGEIPEAFELKIYHETYGIIRYVIN